MFHFLPFPARALLVVAIAGAPQDPFDVEVVRSESAPDVLLHRQAGPLVTVRMSARVDPMLPEGSAELLQELARPRLVEEASRHGARLELRGGGGHAVVAVTGPVETFDALAAMLAHAGSALSLDVATLRRARARAEARVLSGLEQPGPRVRRLLRSAVEGRPPPAGFTAGLLGPDEIRVIRDRLYNPTVVRVVVVGDVTPARVRDAFAEWPVARGPVRAIPAPDSTGSAPQPQAHRERVGVAVPVEADPAVLETAAELLRQHLARRSGKGEAVEVWRTGGSLALAVLGTLPTDAGDGAGPVETGLAEAAGAGDPAMAEAAGRVRNRLLLAARTAAGRAEIIGRLADRDGRPDAAADLRRRLERVRPADVRAALERATRTAPVRVEASA